MAVMPWAADLAATNTLPELTPLWVRWDDAEHMAVAVEQLAAQGLDLTLADIGARKSADWRARAAEINQEHSVAPTEQQQVSSREKLAEIDDRSLQATQDYAAALDAFAKAHARHKKLRAQAYLRFKAEAAKPGSDRLTDGMANMMADGDEDVAAAYLESEINEALVKAHRANLEHLARSFDHHRSLFVREQQVDNR